MAEPMEILRAAVEAIVPGPPHHPAPGALEAGADAFVAGVLARLSPEAAEGVPMALELYAAAGADGRSFAELSLNERSDVLRTMHAEDNADIRAIVRYLFSLTLAAVYADATSGDDGRPAGWEQVGYPGPSTGYDLARVEDRRG